MSEQETTSFIERAEIMLIINKMKTKIKNVLTIINLKSN